MIIVTQFVPQKICSELDVATIKTTITIKTITAITTTGTIMHVRAAELCQGNEGIDLTHNPEWPVCKQAPFNNS